VNPVVTILRAVRDRLSDPRRWIQGTYAGIRTPQGTVIPFWQHRDFGRATCWCLGQAITLALNDIAASLGDLAWTELRSDVEREVLTTLDELGAVDGSGARYGALCRFNDDFQRTSHADVLNAIDKTLERLAPEAA
jgi:hypothetical protein